MMDIYTYRAIMDIYTYRVMMELRLSKGILTNTKIETSPDLMRFDLTYFSAN